MSDESSKIELTDLNNLIENRPWAQKFLSTMKETTEKAVLHWCNALSLNEEVNVDAKVSNFIEKVNNLHQELLLDTSTLREKIIDKIMQSLDRIEQLCLQLNLELPVFDYEDLSLCKLAELMDEKILELESAIIDKEAACTNNNN